MSWSKIAFPAIKLCGAGQEDGLYERFLRLRVRLWTCRLGVSVTPFTNGKSASPCFVIRQFVASIHKIYWLADGAFLVGCAAGASRDARSLGGQLRLRLTGVEDRRLRGLEGGVRLPGRSTISSAAHWQARSTAGKARARTAAHLFVCLEMETVARRLQQAWWI